MTAGSNWRRRNSWYAGIGGVIYLVMGLLPAPVGAAGSEVAHLRVGAALIEASAQSALPATITLPRDFGDDGGKTVVLTEIRYCGVGDQGGGRLRVAGCLGVCEPHPKSVLVGGAACRQDLGDLVAKGKSEMPEGTLLVDLEATWKPWRLKVSTVRAWVLGKDGRARAIGGPDKQPDLFTISTADLRIDAGAGQPILLHAVPTFLAGAAGITIVLAEKAPAKAPASAHRFDESPWTGQTNIAAEIPVTFANALLSRLTGKQPLSLPVNGDEIDVGNVSLQGRGTGKKAPLTLTGDATPRSVRETMRWNLVADGEPLRVSSVRMSAQLEDCSGLATMAALGCNVRNGARATAAEAFGQTLTQRYQGRFVHDLASPQYLRFSVAGQRVELQGDLLRISFGLHGVSAAAHMEPPATSRP